MQPDSRLGIGAPESKEGQPSTACWAGLGEYFSSGSSSCSKCWNRWMRGVYEKREENPGVSNFSGIGRDDDMF